MLDCLRWFSLAEGQADLCSDEFAKGRSQAFVVRIWHEPGLSRPDGRPLWRGSVEHPGSGHRSAFQSLDELARFIQSQIGGLEWDRTERAADDD